LTNIYHYLLVLTELNNLVYGMLVEASFFMPLTAPTAKICICSAVTWRGKCYGSNALLFIGCLR
jgi:hypothetical protein